MNIQPGNAMPDLPDLPGLPWLARAGSIPREMARPAAPLPGLRPVCPPALGDTPPARCKRLAAPLQRVRSLQKRLCSLPRIIAAAAARAALGFAGFCPSGPSRLYLIPKIT